MKLGHELSQRHRKKRNANCLVHPIAAANKESDAFAEGPLGVNVPGARARQHGGELAHGCAAEQRVHATHEPDRRGQPCGAHVAGDLTRGPQNATSDCGPNADRDPKADSQYSQQSTAASFSVGDVRKGGHLGSCCYHAGAESYQVIRSHLSKPPLDRHACSLGSGGAAGS
jgi:hypothetical protein